MSGTDGNRKAFGKIDPRSSPARTGKEQQRVFVSGREVWPSWEHKAGMRPFFPFERSRLSLRLCKNVLDQGREHINIAEEKSVYG